MMLNKLYELLILISRCFFVFLLIFIVARLTGSLVALIKFGYFTLDWKEIILLSIKNASAISIILGLGICVKAWLNEKKDKKNLSK